MAAVALSALVLPACGSSSKKPSSATHPAAHPTTRTTAQSGGASVTSGPVHAALTAANHSPIVGKNWPFSVHVTDASGRPLSGTVKVQFAFGGQVVGTDHPPVHPLKNGVWQENLQFPSAAVGYPLTFQVVAHTPEGSVTLNWPVSVKKS
jgi:hypothetical protein